MTERVDPCRLGLVKARVEEEMSLIINLLLLILTSSSANMF